MLPLPSQILVKMELKNYAAIIAKELDLQVKQVENVLELLDSGATIPFIARYRKEATDSLDEVQIGNIRDRHIRLVFQPLSPYE